jgi:hypothetical protein
MQGNRNMMAIPGNTVSMTLRVTAGGSYEVNDVAADGTIETDSVHGFLAGDPIHLCFYSGLANPYIRVKAIMDDYHFTIEVGAIGRAADMPGIRLADTTRFMGFVENEDRTIGDRPKEFPSKWLLPTHRLKLRIGRKDCLVL